MSLPTYIHHSGWPWPLDGVQDWFESLWDHIEDMVGRIARLVWALTPAPLKDFIDFLIDLTSDIWDSILGFFKDPIGALKEAFDWVISGFTSLIGWWDPEQGRFVGGFLGWLWDAISFIGEQVAMAGEWVYESLTGVLSKISSSVTEFVDLLHNSITGALSWLSDVLWGWVDGALKWASDSFTWLAGEVSSGLSWVVDSVGTMFDGASSIIGDALSSIFTGALDSITGFFSGFTNAFASIDLGGLSSEWGASLAALGFSPEHPVIGHNPNGVEDFLKGVDGWASGIDANVRQMILVSQIVEAASLGQMDVTTIQYFLAPKIRAFTGAATKVWDAEYEARIGIPLTQNLYAKYTPILPPVVDLIRFVVREVITPERFSEIMPYLGFKKEWADAYWSAHWILPAPASLYDAFHRGIINREELDKYLVWHDFNPEPRPGISKTDVEIMRGIIKRMIPRVDLRYAWEMGLISDAELDERYEYLGYEDDSPLMADIQKSRALVEEIHKVRDEWLRYFIEGFIDEATLRANLAAVGIGPARIEYYATYGKKRREREALKEWLDIYEDAYSKDLLTDEELETQASEIIIEPRALKLFLQKAYIRKYKKPKAD